MFLTARSVLFIIFAGRLLAGFALIGILLAGLLPRLARLAALLAMLRVLLVIAVVLVVRHVWRSFRVSQPCRFNPHPSRSFRGPARNARGLIHCRLWA
jgi:hypothetical protein